MRGKQSTLKKSIAMLLAISMSLQQSALLTAGDVIDTVAWQETYEEASSTEDLQIVPEDTQQRASEEDPDAVSDEPAADTQAASADPEEVSPVQDTDPVSAPDVSAPADTADPALAEPAATEPVSDAAGTNASMAIEADDPTGGTPSAETDDAAAVIPENPAAADQDISPSTTQDAPAAADPADSAATTPEDAPAADFGEESPAAPADEETQGFLISFQIPEGVTVLVDDAALTDHSYRTEADALSFSLVTEEGLEISCVKANGEVLQGEANAYTLSGISSDMLVEIIPVYQTEIHYDQNGIRATVYVPESAELPYHAKLHIDPVEKDTQSYREMDAAIREKLDYSEKAELDYLPYDIYFTKGDTDERIEPKEGQIQVILTFEQALDLGWHDSAVKEVAVAHEGKPGYEPLYTYPDQKLIDYEQTEKETELTDEEKAALSTISEDQTSDVETVAEGAADPAEAAETTPLTKTIYQVKVKGLNFLTDSFSKFSGVIEYETDEETSDPDAEQDSDSEKTDSEDTDAEETDPSEADSEEAEDQFAGQRALNYDQDGIHATVYLSEETSLPEDVEFHVDPVSEGTESYTALNAAIRADLNYGEDTDLDILPFDMYFTAGDSDDRIEPIDGQISVILTFDEPIALGEHPAPVKATALAHETTDGIELLAPAAGHDLISYTQTESERALTEEEIAALKASTETEITDQEETSDADSSAEGAAEHADDDAVEHEAENTAENAAENTAENAVENDADNTAEIVSEYIAADEAEASSEDVIKMAESETELLQAKAADEEFEDASVETSGIEASGEETSETDTISAETEDTSADFAEELPLTKTIYTVSVTGMSFTTDGFSIFSGVVEYENLSTDNEKVIRKGRRLLEAESNPTTNYEGAQDLKGLLQELTIQGMNQNETGDYIVKESKKYTISLSFAENVDGEYPTGQFGSNIMYYKLPDLLTIPNAEALSEKNKKNPGQTISVPLEGLGPNGADYPVTLHWWIEAGYVFFEWDLSDADRTVFEKCYNAFLELQLTGTIEKEGPIDWGGIVGEKIYTIDVTKDVAIKKEVVKFDPLTNQVEYKVKVKSTGVNEKVTITDTIGSGATNFMVFDKDLSLAIHNITKETDSTDTATVAEDRASFTYVIGEMDDEEEIEITYAITLQNMGELTPSYTESGTASIGTAEQTQNSVGVSYADGDKVIVKEEKSEVDLKGLIKVEKLGKSVSGGNTETEENGDVYQILNWTITLQSRPEEALNMGGKEISDSIAAQSSWNNDYLRDNTEYYGTGVTISVKDAKGNPVGTSWTVPFRTPDLKEFENTGTNRHWTYVIPKEEGGNHITKAADETNGNSYTYEITYQTKTKVNELLENMSVKNTGSGYGTATGIGTVGPKDGNKFELRKNVSKRENDIVTWTIEVDVPAIGLDGETYLIDALPVDANGKRDKLQAESVNISGLLTDEQYEIRYLNGDGTQPVSQTDAEKIRIDFYKDSGKEKRVY